MQMQRIVKELTKIKNNPPSGIWISPKEDDKYNILQAQIVGPEKTPYYQGMFNLEIHIPEKYPFAPPSIKFITKIYHPNIDDNGRICLDLIKMPPAGNWKPTIGLEGILIAIRMLLENPNPDDPLMGEIAQEYKHSYSEFFKRAQSLTHQYARN
ncbi:hypothetical protein WA026_018465 [Henosepilachna vigintioctopunctata]|uniref:Ubiquitin-conjugating enzyme E2 T n=1 Tax=Henosepilachna vigintioctopunctata TaxID=420089 RepID=A0AAW1V053_9CUCU